MTDLTFQNSIEFNIGHLSVIIRTWIIFLGAFCSFLEFYPVCGYYKLSYVKNYVKYEYEKIIVRK